MASQYKLDNLDSIGPLLTLLFEHTPLIESHLVPQIEPFLQSNEITDYTSLLEKSIQIIFSWPISLRTKFIAAHPRIGATQNLSALSASEQQQPVHTPPGQNIQETSPEVLESLRVLDECYEIRYPRLVYITFVNGRSRDEIADEMRAKLGVQGTQGDQDKIDAIDQQSQEWSQELERAVRDIGLIAGSRLQKLLSSPGYPLS